MTEGSVAFDIPELSRRTRVLRSLATESDDLARRAQQIIERTPSGAGLDGGGIAGTAARIGAQLRDAASDMDNRILFIIVAEETGNPVFLAMAALPASPRLRLPEDVAGLLLAAGEEGIKRVGGRLGREMAIAMKESENLLAQALRTLPKDHGLEEVLLRLSSKEYLKSAGGLERWSKRLKVVGQALDVAGTLLGLYSNYQGSSAQSPAARLVSAGLGEAFTRHPALAAFDLASGGGGSAAADYYAVAGEEAAMAVANLDSRYLFGAGTTAWNDDNLSGENGWMMQSYAELGDAATPTTTKWLDKVHPGFPFDGDGSINWAPSGKTVGKLKFWD